MVHNLNKPDNSIKCWIIAQKKGTNDTWEDYNELSLSNLKKGEWTRLELKTEDLANILKATAAIKSEFDKRGVFFGGQYSLIKGEEARVLTELSKFDKTKLIDTFKKLAPDDLDNISETIKVSRLDKLITEIETNKENADENFWQKLFEQEVWVLSQVFAQPVVVLKDKPYLGGKGLENKGGQYSDLIVQNLLTKNTAIVEIKTPVTELIGKKYRSTYELSEELSGSINQVLKQKQKFLTNYLSLKEESTSDFIAVNPKCVLVVGSLRKIKDDKEKLFAFEGFRNSLKDVEIITYGELYGRLTTIRDLLKQ